MIDLGGTVLGLLLWDDNPGVGVFVGTMLVVSSGLYIGVHERSR